MLAFIFDIAFFFLAKARINAIDGASASIGLGLWLTLAAWICLFFAGCFYCFGRCCISRRPRDEDKRRDRPGVDSGYAEQIRLDAVKAESDRKARQLKGEAGLPAFQEYERTPLTKGDPEEYIDNGHEVLPYNNSGVGAGTAAYTRQGAAPPSSTAHSGYTQGAVGTRAVDDYYNARPNGPRRQGSGMTGHTQTSSTYTASTYSAPAPPVPTIPPPPSANYAAVGASAAAATAGVAAVGAGYLSPQHTGGQYHGQYPSGASAAAYGHTTGGTSCKFPFRVFLPISPRFLFRTLFFWAVRVKMPTQADVLHNSL